MLGRSRINDDWASNRALFRNNQIPAEIAMLDTDGEGTAIIAQTRNGYLVRIGLTQTASLDLARTLLAKVKI